LIGGSGVGSPNPKVIPGKSPGPSDEFEIILEEIIFASKMAIFSSWKVFFRHETVLILPWMDDVRKLHQAISMPESCRNVSTKLEPSNHAMKLRRRVILIGASVESLRLKLACTIRHALKRDSTLAALPWLIGLLLQVSTFTPWFTHHMAV
jgi:hypothetical protein